jgi:GNAT superfamily N-acetyltransferase
MMGHIRRCDRDFELVRAIINDGAQAYKGIIPADRWTEPYMSREKLRHEINEGVVFWGYEETGTMFGVMGIQQVQDVTLIRHAYVRTSSQKRGIGARLLSHLRGLAIGPVLIGTWADAVWDSFDVTYLALEIPREPRPRNAPDKVTTPLGSSSGRTGSAVVLALVSLVSVWGRNWCYLYGTVERVAKDETVEIAVLMRFSCMLLKR